MDPISDLLFMTNPIKQKQMLANGHTWESDKIQPAESSIAAIANWIYLNGFMASLRPNASSLNPRCLKIKATNQREHAFAPLAIMGQSYHPVKRRAAKS
jgi:hypothetical protein